MRVLHIIGSAAAGGAEIYVRDLSFQMIKDGHQVFILFLDRASEARRDIQFEAHFLKQLDDHGVEFDFIGQAARKNPWLGVKKVNTAVYTFLPDIVHCHLYYAAIFSLFVKKAKVIYTHHNIRLGANSLIYKLLDLRVSGYIGICLACKNLLEEVTNKRVTRIDNGVAPERIQKKILDRSRTTVEPVKLLSVGRLSDQKNLALLISSLSKLDSRKYYLKIAGEGPLHEELELLAREKGVSSRIEFLGNVSNVAELLYDADIFVMSSAWEGLPIAQIEATLTGLPVVVTNVGGCAEIVHKVCNGIVVDELVESNYARALEILIDNEQLRHAFSQNALLYSDDYLIVASKNKHLALYNEVLGL